MAHPTNKGQAPPFWQSETALTLFLVALVFLLFFRSPWALRANWPSDDGCYWHTLSGWIGMTPHGCMEEGRRSFYAPGAPLLWLPAALPAIALAWLTNTVTEDWVTPMVGLWSFFLWGIALIFLQKTLAHAHILNSLRWKSSPLAALIILLCVPALYYATHRVGMAHTAEIACAMATLYFTHVRAWAWACVASLLLLLTRYNDAPVVLFLGGAILDTFQKSPESLLPQWSMTTKRWALFGCLAVLCSLMLALASSVGFQNYTLLDLLKAMSWASVSTVFLGLDFGTVWTAPWLIAAVLLGAVFFGRLSWAGRGAWLWIVLEFFLIIGWNGNGGDFGYRYLIGCYAGAIALWIELIGLIPSAQSSFRVLTLFNGITLTFLLFTYRTLPGTGPHNPGEGVYNEFHILHAMHYGFEYFRHMLKIAFYQQIPFVTLYLSFYKSGEAFTQRSGVTGPTLLLLFLFTACATLYCSLFVLRRMGVKSK